MSAVQALARKVRVGCGALQAGTTEAGPFTATKRDKARRFADGAAPARPISGPATPCINGPNGPTGPAGPGWVCGSQTGWPAIAWPRQWTRLRKTLHHTQAIFGA